MLVGGEVRMSSERWRRRGGGGTCAGCELSAQHCRTVQTPPQIGAEAINTSLVAQILM